MTALYAITIFARGSGDHDVCVTCPDGVRVAQVATSRALAWVAVAHAMAGYEARVREAHASLGLKGDAP